MCIQNNPTEARNMLLQNPQLAYALLQAQIVMKIVDPQVAMVIWYFYTYSDNLTICTYFTPVSYDLIFLQSAPNTTSPNLQSRKNWFGLVKYYIKFA